MIPIHDNTALGSDLDCEGHDILNIRNMHPVPPGLVALDDPKLYDPRVPPIGSVTDDSVAATAEIQQSKLSLNGSVPVAWLGTGPDQAAPGNLVERVANKGVPGGYAAVDANGKLLPGNVPTGAASGTVNSIALSTPEGVLVSGSPITTSGTLAVTFKPTLDNSWFGVLDGKPTSFSDKIPLGFVPSLSAIKFTTGTFTTERLPEAVGMGLGHMAGIIPTPGKTGDPNDYIGRDMKWHTHVTLTSYQPTVPTPVITLIAWSPEETMVSITCTLKHVTLFYRVSSGTGAILEEFQKVSGPKPEITIAVNGGDYVEAYAAKAGYNNSKIAVYTVPIPFNLPLT